MIRTTFGAVALFATISTATPAMAQSQQEQLDARYDRALAAGYKALFLCSAIANAEANGTARTPESVHEWELTGIQAPLDDIVRDLPYSVDRLATGEVVSTKVTYADDMPPRYAVHREGRGCVIMPIGTTIDGVGAEYVIWALDDDARAAKRQQLQAGRSRPDPMASDWAEKRVDVSAAFTGKYGEGRTTIVTVLNNGKLAGEQYADGFFANTPQRTWSVAKSIAATLVGAAVYRGAAEPDASAGLGVNEADPRRAITIDHALRMASGRYSDTPGNRTDPLYWGGTTVDQRAQNWPLIHTPGTVYRYANNDTLAAVKAIEGIFAEHSPANFFAKIGMHHTVAETDWQGNYVLSSQVWSTARDLAKLGQLYLNDGVLPNGERVLPKNWRDYVSTPSGPQPQGTDWGYGAGWWTFKRPEGNAFEGIPDDAFAARGNRGQYIVIVPSRNVVIVRRGEDMVGTRFDIAAFTRDVLAALD